MSLKNRVYYLTERSNWARASRRRVGDLVRAVRVGHLLLSFRSVRAVSTWLEPGLEPASMNGQRRRREIVRQIATVLPFESAVETGTYRGSTTAFIADVLGCDVWTVEIDPLLASLARRRLGSRSDVHLHEGDSRSFLCDLPEHLRHELAFFYLDAHWGKQLPLWEEVAFVTANWDDPVVLIDDFAVPGDPGYGYDDYGPEKSLDIAHLSPHIPDGYTAWFPKAPSEQETGGKRGCVVLARRHHDAALEMCPLRRWFNE